MPDFEQELLDYIEKVLPVASARAQYVINKILRNGEISSEDIRDEGYVHGARAIGDVRDQGIPLITLKTKSTDGRSIAKYIFGNAEDIKKNKFGGRINFPYGLKIALVNEQGPICSLSGQELAPGDLQIDHRIPFFISGDITGARDTADFMLLSRPMQRSKSWACENCENIKVHFDENICRTCYWANPEDYDHISMKVERRVDLTFSGTETAIYDQVKEIAKTDGHTIQQTLKRILNKSLNRN